MQIGKYSADARSLARRPPDAWGETLSQAAAALRVKEQCICIPLEGYRQGDNNALQSDKTASKGPGIVVQGSVWRERTGKC